MKVCLNQFLDYVRAERNYSPHTVEGYQTDIEQFINLIPIEQPSDITKPNIRAFLSKLDQKRILPRSRNRKLAAIKRFCKFLKEEGYIAVNESLEVEYAKIEKRLPVIFTETEISSVIDSAEDKERDQAILETLYATGVRVAELVGIKVADVDFRNQTIKVFGKRSVERIVPTTERSLGTIIAHLRSRKHDSEYLFPSPYNATVPITTRTARNVVYKYGSKTKVSSISPHKFRHSCATHMHQHGMDIRDVQQMLGHADIGSTTIYTHVVLDSLSKSYHSAHPRG